MTDEDDTFHVDMASLEAAGHEIQRLVRAQPWQEERKGGSEVAGAIAEVPTGGLDGFRLGLPAAIREAFKKALIEAFPGIVEAARANIEAGVGRHRFEVRYQGVSPQKSEEGE
jgi:hypothetical protein